MKHFFFFLYRLHCGELFKCVPFGESGTWLLVSHCFLVFFVLDVDGHRNESGKDM